MKFIKYSIKKISILIYNRFIKQFRFNTDKGDSGICTLKL